MKGVFVLKANESVKNYESTRRMYANYTARSIKKVCNEIGPRFAGSEEEKKSIEYMAEDMKTCCNDVQTYAFVPSKRAERTISPLGAKFATVARISQLDKSMQ